MPIIEGTGQVITGGVVDQVKPTTYYGSGAPTGGVTYDGAIVNGDLYVDVDTQNVYEFTDVDTFTRIDTV